MKKLLLCSGLLLLCNVSNAQNTQPKKPAGYKLATEILTSKRLLVLGLQHNDPVFRDLYFTDAYQSATNAFSIWNNIKPQLKQKLTVEDMLTIEDEIQSLLMFSNMTAENGGFEGNKIGAVAVWSATTDILNERTLPKILR